MSSFIQMGHNTQNLVGEKDLSEFSGIILSPINRYENELFLDIQNFEKKGDFKIVLDPQFYNLSTRKEQIKSHSYFPDDFETSDLSSIKYWKELNKHLLDYCYKQNIQNLTSPAFFTHKFTQDYYEFILEINSELWSEAEDDINEIWTTIIVNCHDITDEAFLMELASQLSTCETDGFYLVIKYDLKSRRELNDVGQLSSVLRLIKELSTLDKQITIAYSSSDMMLYKMAGATNCCSGNYSNLRRFNLSRFNEITGGGRQPGYLYSHNLAAFIRESDIGRLNRSGYDEYLLGEFSENHWSRQIFSQFRNKPGQPWVRLGWRQYLSWFGKFEKFLEDNIDSFDLDLYLDEVEERWFDIETDLISFDEAPNDGHWVEKWRESLASLS